MSSARAIFVTERGLAVRREVSLRLEGLLDEALALDLRRPQDYFQRIWNTGFRASSLTAASSIPAGDQPDRAGSELEATA